MRGYFAIGIEGVSKTGNIGNLIRTAHGFGAAFCFTLREMTPDGVPSPVISDTSQSVKSIPFFEFNTLDEAVLPKACQLVGVELCEDAVELPSFRHPHNAVYILGSERLSISKDTMERCDHIIKIPTKFCLNVATAGAIVMYDRMISYGKFAERAVTSVGKPVPVKEHVRGGPRLRKLERST